MCYRLAAVLLVLIFAGTSAQAAETTVNKIVAVVNGEMITLHELRMHTAAEMARQRMDPKNPKAEEVQKEILDALINDILLRQEARRFKVSVSDAEVRVEVNNAIARTGRTPGQFEADLKAQGITMEMYNERMRNNLLRMRMSTFMVDRKVFVTPEEVADFFDKNPDMFQGERTADFSVIMLPERVDAQGIYRQIRAGTLSFEDAARRHSAEPNAQDGGLVRGVPYDRLPPEMQKLLSSLSDGGISQLLRTAGGFYVFRRDAINEAKPLTFQEARPYIEEILLAPLREERAKEYVGQLRSRAVIDIRM
jgi:peptidyl-prolyl cis-trans isomerase SurA